MRVEISDRGIGIDATLLPRVFDLFAQGATGLGRHEAGLGIGLTVVQQLVLGHGGTVEVESAGIGCGSTFVVHLPRVYDDAVKAAPEETVSAIAHPQRILLVDDNVDSLHALEALLSINGHVCRVATTGKQALSIATGFGPTAAIIDIGLPDMSGFDVGEALLEKLANKRPTLIGLSGYATAEFRDEAALKGFDGFFAKPTPIEELLRFLAALPGPKSSAQG